MRKDDEDEDEGEPKRQCVGTKEGAAVEAKDGAEDGAEDGAAVEAKDGAADETKDDAKDGAAAAVETKDETKNGAAAAVEVKDETKDETKEGTIERFNSACNLVQALTESLLSAGAVPLECTAEEQLGKICDTVRDLRGVIDAMQPGLLVRGDENTKFGNMDYLFSALHPLAGLCNEDMLELVKSFIRHVMKDDEAAFEDKLSSVKDVLDSLEDLVRNGLESLAAVARKEGRKDEEEDEEDDEEDDEEVDDEERKDEEHKDEYEEEEGTISDWLAKLPSPGLDKPSLSALLALKATYAWMAEEASRDWNIYGMAHVLSRLLYSLTQSGHLKAVQTHAATFMRHHKAGRELM